MTDEQLQMLAAAMLSEPQTTIKYVGPISTLLEAVNEKRRSSFTLQDARAAFEMLARIGGSYRSSMNDMVHVDPKATIAMIVQNRAKPRFDKIRRFPILTEYARFGDGWLDQEWPSLFPPRKIEPVTSDEEKIVAPADWIDIKMLEIDESNRDVVREKLEQALCHLDDHHLTNFQRQQTVALLRGSLELLDAPEPPSEVIWNLVARAADVSGLAQFFLGLLIGLVG